MKHIEAISETGECRFCGRDYSGDLSDPDITIGGRCPSNDCPSNVEMQELE